MAARFGKVLEPTFAPIFNPNHTRPEAWKDSIALTAGFLAKEIVVSTMAVVNQAKVSEKQGKEDYSALQESLAHRSGLTPLTALAFMIFTLIYTPCLGTVGMILKETRSLAWTSFTVVYGLGLAWLLAWFTVLGGHAMGFR